MTNRLLEALPEKERRSMLAMLEPVPLPVGTCLFEAHKRPRFAHFLTSGMLSLVTTMADGAAVEVGLVGREGIPETVFTLGPELGSKMGTVQLAGTALRMSFQRFEQEFHSNESLRRLVLRYSQFDALVLAQLAACNRLHSVNERLARWLLMVMDRTGETTLALTQEFLGQMLGTRRSSVTLAAGELQKAGLIEYRRADIRLLDVDRLRKAACECSRIIHDLYENLYR